MSAAEERPPRALKGDELAAELRRIREEEQAASDARLASAAALALASYQLAEWSLRFL